MKTIATTLIIFGILFTLTGIFYNIPERVIPYDYKEYVGGDAYNLIIEASILGGEISGAQISKTIYTVFGWSLIIAGGILIQILNLLKEKPNNNNSSTTNFNL